MLSADPFFGNAVVRNVEVTKIDPGTPAILVTNLGNTNTPGLFADGVGTGSTTFTSATATFVPADAGQPIIETDGLGRIAAGTRIASFVNATTVVLSAAIAAGSGIAFSLPSRVTPPANFADGAATGTTTFTSASAGFALTDVGQPVVETDGGAAIPADTVILAVLSATQVTLSASVAAASNIGFSLPSRLASFAQFRDGATTAGSTTLGSSTAAFNASDIGRPVMEGDFGNAIPAGTVILAVSADGSSATMSAAAVATTTGLVFALPARNASNVILGGSGNAATAISGFYAVALAAAPSAPVTVTVTAPGDPRVSLSSTDPRFSQVSAPDGTNPGVYRIAFGTTDWTVPVIVRVDAALWFGLADPHNAYLTATVDPASGSAPEYLGVDNSASPWDVLVMSDQTPAGIVQAPDGMVVTKCADLACTRPGPGSSYSVRLSMAPAGPVTVAMITDGQTDVVAGGRVSYAAIGAMQPVTLFTGNVTISGQTVTRAAGSELGSFVASGFAVGQLVSLSGGTYAGTVTTTITAVTASAMTLAASPTAGAYSGVKIARIVNHGLFTGAVLYDPLHGTLTRADGSSWLDDNFLEGQSFVIGSSTTLLKIQALTGTTATRVDILTVTDPAALATVLGSTCASGCTPTLTQWAASVTFTPQNWWIPVGIPLLADPKFNVPAGNANLLMFPKTPHLLAAIRGPLSVEGGPVQDSHTALQLPVMLPAETNSVPFGIGVQPPEAQQVNVLNVFDDGSQQNQKGVLSSTSLTGFGMGPTLDFTHHKGYVPGDPAHPTFGEPAVFPGGVSFGSITVDPSTGNILTNASLSTIQVFNFMQGQGNDRLSVTGTLVGGPFTNEDGSPGTTYVHGGLTVLNGGGAAALSVTGTFTITTSTVHRLDGAPWADAQFAIGQELLFNGMPFGVITGVSGATLTFVGSAPA
ncbi:MAG: hypothetical protein EPN43_01380, partial [Jatrophihabitans sp.]